MSAVMDAFGEKLEDMEVMERTVSETLDQNTATMIKQDDVNLYSSFALYIFSRNLSPVGFPFVYVDGQIDPGSS